MKQELTCKCDLIRLFNSGEAPICDKEFTPSYQDGDDCGNHDHKGGVCFHGRECHEVLAKIVNAKE